MNDRRERTPDPRLSPRPVLRRLARADHGGPSAADHAGSPIRADFSTSVNAYGPAPGVLTAIRDALDIARVSAYPDPSSTAARTALASRLAVDRASIAIGSGATELILAIAMAFVRAGDRVLIPHHAFAEYERATILSGGHVVHPETDRSQPGPPMPGVAIDVLVERYERAVATRSPRIAFLCTPESPSGRAWPLSAVQAVADACARAGTLLVLDQSFDAFSEKPLGTPALRGHPATLHLRSLTKDHGLAGLRVGYVVGPNSLVAAVEQSRMPWMVSAPAQAAIVATCTPEASAYVDEMAGRLRTAARDVGTAARDLDIPTVPSDTHYLLLDVGDAADVTHRLRKRHALKVRDCTSFGLPSYVRVAARTPGDNRLLLTALSDVIRTRPTTPYARGGARVKVR
jgi:histidinol-phosphate/aromatic aminotransferase/cobyric acid decarboxylase-like protein